VLDDAGARFYARGARNAGGGDAVDADTVFEIGSITKVFTALLLQDMVDHGEVKLDDPISRYLPASVKAPSRDGKEITLLDLATQHSGLPRLPENLSPKDGANPYADYTVEQLYQFLSGYKLTRDIGAKYEYSNLGVGLLGHLLSLKAGTNYEALVVNRVCEPLGMRHTRMTLTPELKARLATGHNKLGLPVANWDIPTLAGAGALRSTAADMVKFLSLSMGKTASPLAEAVAKCEEPRADAGGTQRIGLAWHIGSNFQVTWHNGGTGGYRSYLGFNKARHRGVVVLGNSENSVDDLGLYLLGAVKNIEPYSAAKQRQVAKIDHAIYDKYVGSYRFTWLGPYLTVTRDGDRLLAQLTAQSAFEVFPESPTDFFYTVVEAQLTFVTNQSGTTTDVILHQNGRDQKATKVK